MKKLLLLLLLLPATVLGQTGGFLNLNDFGLPTYPYQFSRFWLRGSTPAGSNPIIESYGLSALKLYPDTIFMTKLALREDASPNKLVWIDANGMLKAITPTYLLPADTINKWLGVGTTIPSSQVNSDWNSISGISEILNKPTLKRIETYLGTTDGSGNYTVTYGTAFSATPDVQPQLQTSTINQFVRITASSTTGFTVNATQRAVLSILGLDVLAGTATNLSGASVGVLVTSR